VRRTTAKKGKSDRRRHASTGYADARDRDCGVREELAAGMIADLGVYS
jgi:hypothetical protein